MCSAALRAMASAAGVEEDGSDDEAEGELDEEAAFSFRPAQIAALERQHCSPITAAAAVGSVCFLGARDGRILSYLGALPRGPLRSGGAGVFAGQCEELTAAAAAAAGAAEPEEHGLLVAACGGCGLRGWRYDAAAAGAEALQEVLSIPDEGHVCSVALQDGFALSGAKVTIVQQGLRTDGAACLWDVEHSDLALAFFHRKPVARVRFFGDGGKYVCTGDAMGCVRLYDPVASPESPAVAISGTGGAAGFATSGARGLLALPGCPAGASAGHEVDIYEPLRAGARCVTRLMLPWEPIALEFALDGRCLVAAGPGCELCAVRPEDNFARLFDVTPLPELGAVGSAASRWLGDAPHEVPQELALLRGVDALPRDSRRQTLLWSYRDGGWGFGELRARRPEGDEYGQ